MGNEHVLIQYISSVYMLTKNPFRRKWRTYDLCVTPWWRRRWRSLPFNSL